jgi:hypothetical protein
MHLIQFLSDTRYMQIQAPKPATGCLFYWLFQQASMMMMMKLQAYTCRYIIVFIAFTSSICNMDCAISCAYVSAYVGYIFFIYICIYQSICVLYVLHKSIHVCAACSSDTCTYALAELLMTRNRTGNLIGDQTVIQTCNRTVKLSRHQTRNRTPAPAPSKEIRIPCPCLSFSSFKVFVVSESSHGC